MITIDTFFTAAEYERRLALIRTEMRRRRLDAMIVSAPENIFYASGYHTKAVFTFQFLVLFADRPSLLFTRQMEISNAERALKLGHIGEYTVFQDDEDPMEVAIRFLSKALPQGKKVGIELASWAMSAKRAQDITSSMIAIDWEDASILIDRIRMVKSDAEIAILREAGNIGDRMADRACAAVAAGKTENDVAQAVMSEMVLAGCEYPGSWPNVMAGTRTGLIHAAWGSEKVLENDHVTMEITGVKARYHAPSWRTVFTGRPLQKLIDTAEILTLAHDAAVRAVEPGLPLKVINEAAQSILAKHKLECTVAKRSGYSLGIGFPPSWGAQWQIGLNSIVDDPLEIGMAFHIVNVGIFDDGRALAVGCTVALTENGPERLTRTGIHRA